MHKQAQFPVYLSLEVEVVAPQKYSFLFSALAFVLEVRSFCCLQAEQRVVEPVDLDPTPLLGVPMVALRHLEYKRAVFALNPFFFFFCGFFSWYVLGNSDGIRCFLLYPPDNSKIILFFSVLLFKMRN